MRCYKIALLTALLGSLSLNAWMVSGNKRANHSVQRAANPRKMASLPQNSRYSQGRENTNFRPDPHNRLRYGKSEQHYPVSRLPYKNRNDQPSNPNGIRPNWRGSSPNGKRTFNDGTPYYNREGRIVDSSPANRAGRRYRRDNDEPSRVERSREERYRSYDREDRRYWRRGERDRGFVNRWDDDSFGIGGFGDGPWLNPGIAPNFLLQAYFSQMAFLYPVFLMMMFPPLMPPPPPPPPPLLPPPEGGGPLEAGPLPYAPPGPLG